MEAHPQQKQAPTVLDSWLRSEHYFPRGLGLKKEVQAELRTDYHSQVVEKLREKGFHLEAGEVSLYLAKEFGFCYGVDRAVDYAYETCRMFPDRRIFLANEIIHNPHVNEKLESMGVRFLPQGVSLQEKLQDVRPEDVVLVSAFGSPVKEMQQLQSIGCTIIDTTCGSVMSVWKRIEMYAREGITAIIHGKYQHEETRATCSRVSQYPGGRYLVVRDLEEAAWVCRHIVHGGDKSEFSRRFSAAASSGFDPNVHLEKVGLANQTTMLSEESLRIAKKIGDAMAEKFGAEPAEKRFYTFDTICSATQDRQDAVLELLKGPLDLMLVIGGYNSSNTTHLAEMAGEKIPAYHISDASCLTSARKIRFKPVDRAGEVEKENWLPSGKVKIGITSGASTPDSKVGEAIERILALKGK